MKIKIAFALIGLVLTLKGFSQINVELPRQSADSTEGFFVKAGKQKLASLECYNFDNLTLAFNVDPSYFQYEKIIIQLEVKSGQFNEYAKRVFISGKEFNRRFSKGSTYVYFTIFSTANMKEESEWEITRAELEYASTLFLVKNARLVATIYGVTRIGDPELDSWNYQPLKEVSIELLNRKKPGFMKSAPAEPANTGSCY